MWHAREDLDQLVGLLDREHRHLRAEQSERLTRLRAPDGRADLIACTRASTIARPRSPEAPVTITVIAARCYRRDPCCRAPSGSGRYPPRCTPIPPTSNGCAVPSERRRSPGVMRPGTARRPTGRFVVDLENGRSAFVKIAAFDYTAEWLRDEYRVSTRRSTGSRSCLGCLAGTRTVIAPALALEDLSGRTMASTVGPRERSTPCSLLSTLHACDPAARGRAPPRREPVRIGFWPDVAADPRHLPRDSASARPSGSTTTCLR